MAQAFGALAGFVMRGYWQASVFVGLMALLSLFFPPLVYLSGASLALITLRRGWAEGLQVLVAALLGMALVFELGFGKAMASVGFGTVLWGPIWALASVLRWTRSLAGSLSIATAVTLVLVLSLLWLAPEQISAFWLQVFRLLQLKVHTTGANPTAETAAQLFHALSWVATGIAAAGLLLSWFLALLLGRWWQGLLYNPGGFGGEFRALHLGRSMGAAGVAVLALLLLAEGFWKLLGLTLSPVLAVPLGLAGIALVHWLRYRFDASSGWLIGMYLVLATAPLAGLPKLPEGLRAMAVLPQLLLSGLVVIGFLDCWLDIRRRLGEPSGT